MIADDVLEYLTREAKDSGHSEFALRALFSQVVYLVNPADAAFEARQLEAALPVGVLEQLREYLRRALYAQSLVQGLDPIPAEEQRMFKERVRRLLEALV